MSAEMEKRAAQAKPSVGSFPIPKEDVSADEEVLPVENGSALPAWKLISLLLLVPVCSSAIQLPLTPSHGGLPSMEYHQLLFQTCIIVYFALRMFAPGLLSLSLSRQTALVPVLVSWIPVVQLYLLPTAREYGPSLSSALIQVVTWIPMQALLLSTIRTGLESSLPDSFQFFGHLFALGLYFAADFVWGIFYPELIGMHWILSRPYLLLLVATAFMILFPSRLLLLAALPYFHTLLLNPHSTLSIPTARLNSTLDSHGFSLLAREESITGYLSILENKNAGYRVLRCDHSILGGDWKFGLGNWPGGVDYKGIPKGKVAEPVYAVFTMLEAVRLVQDQPSSGRDSGKGTEDLVPDSEAKALIIGLGIGTTPAALISHGIETTVVELDPAVYRLAIEYFDLPLNHTAEIKDATIFVKEELRTLYPKQDESEAIMDPPSTESQAGKYDYIVHDVFTGGAEPAELFTREFIQGLHDLLKPNGVVAINYASDLALPSASLVFTTVLSVFPACRLFRDHPKESESEASTDFVNTVLFCRKKKAAFGFRKPVEEDFLGTQARRMSLLPTLEVDLEQFVPKDESGEFEIDEEKVIRKGKTEELEKWHHIGATKHWQVMRNVMPDEVWELW